jgi:hypothetical protein
MRVTILIWERESPITSPNSPLYCFPTFRPLDLAKFDSSFTHQLILLLSRLIFHLGDPGEPLSPRVPTNVRDSNPHWPQTAAPVCAPNTPGMLDMPEAEEEVPRRWPRVSYMCQTES